MQRSLARFSAAGRRHCSTTSALPIMPPRCAKWAIPESVPVTPNRNSAPAYSVANSHAGMGIGGISGTTLRCGNIMAKASSRPNTPPDAPSAGAERCSEQGRHEELCQRRR